MINFLFKYGLLDGCYVYNTWKEVIINLIIDIILAIIFGFLIFLLPLFY